MKFKTARRTKCMLAIIGITRTRVHACRNKFNQQKYASTEWREIGWERTQNKRKMPIEGSITKSTSKPQNVWNGDIGERMQTQNNSPNVCKVAEKRFENTAKSCNKCQSTYPVSNVQAWWHMGSSTRHAAVNSKQHQVYSRIVINVHQALQQTKQVQEKEINGKGNVLPRSVTVKLIEESQTTAEKGREAQNKMLHMLPLKVNYRQRRETNNKQNAAEDKMA